MDRFRQAGLVWLIATAFAVAITVIYRTDRAQWLVTIAAAAVGGASGSWLIARPSAHSVPLSNVSGGAWLIIYGLVTAQQLDKIGAWTTDVFLAALGTVAAILALRAIRVTNPTGRAP